MLTQLLTKIFTGEAGVYVARMRAVISIYAAMGVIAVGLVGFLLLALFFWLSAWIGPVMTALAFAFVCLLLLIGAYVALVMARRPPKQRASDRLQRDIASVATVAAMSNLPWFFRSARRHKGLILVPVALAGAWGIVRSVRNTRWRV